MTQVNNGFTTAKEIAMARWAGEMEFEFIEDNEGGAFVTTSKVVQFLRNHLARGETEAAARLYEESGANVLGDLLEDAKSASSSTKKNLAEMFVLARDFASAARVFELAKDFGQAARHYEQGSDFVSAARCFKQNGDTQRAAAALERAGQVEEALALYRQAGPSDALAECLARQRRYMEAATIYQQVGNMRGEVEMLRLVPLEAGERLTAVERLADLLERFGRMDQAVQLIVDTVRQIPAAQNNIDLYQRLARLLDGLGRSEQANLVRARIQNQMGGQVIGERRALPQQTVDPLAAPVAADPIPAGVTPAAPVPAAVPGTPAVAAPAPAVPAPVPAAPAPAPVAASPVDGLLPPQAAPTADPFASYIDPFAGSEQGGVPNAVDPYAQLKAIPIFGELSMVDMKDLYRICQEVTFTSGTTIIEQGVQGSGLTVALVGELQVLRVEGSVATPLAVLEAGAYVGEMSLVDDAPTSARVIAKTPVRALFISRDRFDQYLYGHPTAALRTYRLFTKTLAERLRQSNVRK